LSQIRQVYGLAAPRASVAAVPAGGAIGAGGTIGAIGGRAAMAPAASIYSGAVQQGGRLLARLDRQLAAADRLLQEAREFERSRAEEVRGTPSVCPLRGGDFVLTSGFGRRQSPFSRELQFHAGLDLAAPADTPIHAPADGAVTFAGTYPVGRGMTWWRLGNLVIVRHGERFFTVYGHCGELKVRAGQKVRQGEVLATVGRSGWSTNPLLYYEIRRRGADGLYRPTDPRLYILDYRWPNEERLLAGTGESPRPSEYDSLPVAPSGVGRSLR
ncbi:MAG TPA: M23 family metallopeptidase, partial [Thermoanaerobaculia bacterium]|nr:M23 family metallopeptidase [Thermoanaerobaculia bacterium]